MTNLLSDFLSVARRFATKVQWKAIYGGSRREAINAHCRQCMGEDRKAVVECQDLSCPLRPFRPGKPRGERRPPWLQGWK